MPETDNPVGSRRRESKDASKLEFVAQNEIAPARRKYEIVVDRILKLVEEQKLEPGEALPTERVVAEMLGVSRNVTRQAFGVLEERGLIRTRQGAGRYLRTSAGDSGATRAMGASKASLEIASVADVLEARMIIEVEAIALACERRTAVQAQELMDQAERLVGWDDNVEFHVAMAAATQNFALENLVRQQILLSGELHQRELYKADESESLEQMRTEHRAIASAIMARDVARARSLAREHLTQTRNLILHSLEG